MTAGAVQIEVQKLANPVRAAHSARYFKTGPGQYGAGDVFLGLNTPQVAVIVKKYSLLPLSEIATLLRSPVHEHRSIALSILKTQFSLGDDKTRTDIFHFYLKSTRYINNWDLVDISAPHIVGGYLLDKPKDVLFKLAQSDSLWERRIAIISTFAFLSRGRVEPTLEIATLLLKDQHDLIHKAVGWALREVGKRVSQAKLEEFLTRNYARLPRTTLRYAIERFPAQLRQHYLHLKK